jgi:predicted nucleic acid-binding protein
VIFVDTSAWVALAARRDEHHDDALALLRRLDDETLVTSNHVVGETWTFLNRRYGHAVAVSFLDRAESSERVEVVFVEHELEVDALAWLRRREDREYSFVDATSFAVMRTWGIARALAFDGDFAAAGFTEARP